MIGLGMGLGLRRPRGPLRLVDPDAAAFVAAAGITDATQRKAVNTFVLAMKAGGLWSRFFSSGAAIGALYPFVGGNATAHSFNLIDPTKFRITWHGTITHDANGITGDGATGYGDTGLAGNNATFVNNLAFGVYNRTPGGQTAQYINAGGGKNCGINNAFDGNAYWDNTDQSRFSSVSSENGLGTNISSRTSATSNVGYQQGLSRGTSSAAQGSLPTGNFLLLTFNTLAFIPANLSLAFVSTGLSSGDVTTFDTAIKVFQTSLERNV